MFGLNTVLTIIHRIVLGRVIMSDSLTNKTEIESAKSYQNPNKSSL